LWLTDFVPDKKHSEIAYMQTSVMPVRRGLRIYQSLLFEESSTATPKKESKGRSAELIEKRDDLLLHRFYFKSKIERKIYEDALRELEAELHISKVMIQKIIQAKGEVLLTIKQQGVNKAELKQKFPWVVW
jgi:hypothetical protein